MMTTNEKDSLLSINLNKLEVDAAEQARRLRQWADKLARAEKEAKTAKNQLRVVKAELSKVVRSSPGKYGIVKVTDTSVEDAVVTLTSFKEAQTLLVDAEYSRDMLKNMVIALHERGEQIGNEVKLHGQQYWARPRVDPETHAGIVENDREETMRETNQKLKKGKNRE